MSTESVTATPVAEVTVASKETPVVETKGAPAAPASTETKAENGAPNWLPERLERERKSLLKELGIDNLADAKKLISDANAKREAEKSDAQKRGELEKILEGANKRLEETTSALKSYAEAQLKALSEPQRAAVSALAGEDPAMQLKAIETLRPTWASAAAATAVEKPKDTAIAPSAPNDASSQQSPPDLMAIYNEWKTKNPVWAARFADANQLFTKK
jgi:hypothetical protein